VPSSVPSLLKRVRHTQLAWDAMVVTHLPLLRSHTLTSLSSPAEHTTFSSGW
jgi:hypothetical protein